MKNKRINSGVGTNGWDVISMMDVNTLNKQINSNSDYMPPSNFDSSILAMGENLSIKGSWGEWLIDSQSDGGLIYMHCIIESGVVSFNGENYDMNEGNKESFVVIIVKLAGTEVPVNKWNSDDDTSIVVPGQTHSFEIKICDNQTYNIVVVDLQLSNPIMSDTATTTFVSSAFEQWFNDNKQSFEQIFSIVLIGLEAKDPSYQWLKPTAYSYAAASSLDNSLTAFGSLTLVDGNTDTSHLASTLDLQALSWAIKNGANTAIVVSNIKFTQHILLDAAISVIKGASSDDFIFDETGLVIKNKNEIEWQDFEADDGKIYTPVIPQNGFLMSVQSDYININIQGAYFYPNAGHKAVMGLDQNFRFSVGYNSAGDPVFVVKDDGMGDATITSVIIPTDGVVKSEKIGIVVSIIAGIICAFTGFVTKCADAALETLTLGADSAYAAFLGAESTFVAETTVDVVSTAAEIAAGSTAAAPSIFNTVKVASAILAGISGTVVIGEDLADAIYSNKYQNIPSFEFFADNIAAAIKWPTDSKLELISATIEDCFLIGVNYK